MSNQDYTIGIFGGGVVGKAVASFFDGAQIYDKFNAVDPIESVLGCDLIFVCVPTPFKDGEFDRSILEEVFAEIAKDKKERIVVIKSTSIPGTTDYFQDKYSHLKVLFNPEFLTEKTNEQDFLKPDKQIIGFTEKSRDISESVLNILPNAPYKKSLPSKSAELVKYAVNTFYATKVTFGNMLYDFTKSLGIDYTEVKEAFVSDQRITDSHFDVLHGGYRGYGGKCLPKDLLALALVGNKNKVDVSLLETVDKLNTKYINESKDKS
jgi:UDPglucose 6-dehydrogenase